MSNWSDKIIVIGVGEVDTEKVKEANTVLRLPVGKLTSTRKYKEAVASSYFKVLALNAPKVPAKSVKIPVEIGHIDLRDFLREAVVAIATHLS